MKSYALCLSTVYLMYLTSSAEAATHFVSLNSTNPTPPYTNWVTAATNIQDAVDAALGGDSVMVSNGVYRTGGRAIYGTNRVAVTKPIIVQSVNGFAGTIIEGYQAPGTGYGSNAIRCVYLTNGASLIGFTLTNGGAAAYLYQSAQSSGGAIWCESTNAIISNCLMVVNSALDGGGAYQGTLMNCTLTRNTASGGGGAAFGTLNNCSIISNVVSIYGGATESCALDSCAVIGNLSTNNGGGIAFGISSNCIVTANTSYYGGGACQANLIHCTLFSNSAVEGGGAFQGMLDGCDVEGNRAAGGGGTYESIVLSSALAGNWATNAAGGAWYGMITNCTITGNYSQLGGGTWGSTQQNCIVYYNYAAKTADNYSGGALDHCCTWPKPLNGTGNLDSAPRLASAIHLSADSPCRGAGEMFSQFGTDIDGEPWLNPPSIGCDEYYSGGLTGLLSAAIEVDYTNVGRTYPVNLTAKIAGRASMTRWDFGDGAAATNQPYLAHGWATAGDYPVVLTAYNDSNSGGISATSVVHVVNQVHYVSTNSSSPTAPYISWATAATNIQQAVNAATVPGALVLVSNGVYRTGSTWISGYLSNRVAITKPLILQSVNGPSVTAISGFRNPDPVAINSLRCVYLTNGVVLSGFTITNGSTINAGDTSYEQAGGGIWCQSFHSIISNCVITRNFSWYQGAGVNGGTLYSCLLFGNVANQYGGGTYNSILNNSLIVSNSALYGGGANLAILNNCTVSGNSAPVGAGMVDGIAKNCILYYNAGDNYSHLYSNQNLSLDYCCTTPLTNGVGNITNEPGFVKADGGNFRLQTNSACVNQGYNFYVLSGTDLDNRPRIVDGTVDLGAYEFQGAVTGEFIGWLRQYGLPTDGSADYADTDNDGMNNWQEWKSGTNPTNVLSLLRMLSGVPTNNPPRAVVTWQSVTNINYFLQRSSALSAQPSFSTIQTDIAGQTGTTTCTDTFATNGGPYFYRVGVQ
jgi:hypothetical protein